MLSSNPRDLFQEIVQREQPRPVLEIGTCQSVPGHSTHRMHWFPYIERSNYTMADKFEGSDVDETVDIHNIPSKWNEKYQAFIALSVFEHLERPWIAAKNVFKLLSPGGICYIATHQSFPIHGFPQDFFRFSDQALSLIFEDAGFTILSSGYEERCKIVPSENIIPNSMVDQWNNNHPSYIHVHLTARKPVS